MKAEEIAAEALASMENSKSDSENDSLKEVNREKETMSNDEYTSGGRHGDSEEENSSSYEPRVIQVVKKPRAYMNHSYKDYSSVPPEEDDEVVDIKNMSFPEKVHHMLSQAENEKWIRWMPHGRAFLVVVPKMLETKVLPKYLGHSRYSSFLRQLSNHGFKHISQGPDRNCHYHELMLRGLPHLTKLMPKPKDARRLIPDPENEPNFYSISKKYPLPDDPNFDPEDCLVTGPMKDSMVSSDNSVTEASHKRAVSDVVSIEASSVLPSAKRHRPAVSLGALPTPTIPTSSFPKSNLEANLAAVGLQTSAAIPSFQQTNAIPATTLQQLRQQRQSVQVPIDYNIPGAAALHQPAASVIGPNVSALIQLMNSNNQLMNLVNRAGSVNQVAPSPQVLDARNDALLAALVASNFPRQNTGHSAFGNLRFGS